MIKLKDLLNEAGHQSLLTVLGSPKLWDTDGRMIHQHGWNVLSAFDVTVSTGKHVPSNVYYGASRVSKDPGRVEKARKGDLLVQLSGGPFLVSPGRKKAWKIMKLGPQRSMEGSVDNEAPRTKIPKSSVQYVGDAEYAGLTSYSTWKSWIVAQ